MLFNVSLYRDEDGIWVISCPSIPGCINQGQTKAEALEKIKGCIEVRAEPGMPLTVESGQVEVPL